MYLNTKKEDTNIDKEFKNREKEPFDFSKYKIPIFIGLGVLGLIILIVVIIMLINKPKYTITLYGNKEINMYVGNEYEEIGYSAKDKKGNDLTSKVKVTNNIDNNTIGSYIVKYELGKNYAERKVNVIEKGIGNTTFYLKGKSEYEMEINTEYIEPGYIVIDSVDGDISSKVTVNNQIDNTKEGTYHVVYSVVNSSDITTTITRIVIVKDHMKNLPVEK